MTDLLSAIDDDEFADMIFRALIKGCVHDSSFRPHHPGIVIESDACFDLKEVARKRAFDLPARKMTPTTGSAS